METLNYTYTCTHTLLTSPKGAFIFNYPHDIWLSFRRRVVITPTCQYFWQFKRLIAMII